MLRIECPKCGAPGRYDVARYGADAKPTRLADRGHHRRLSQAQEHRYVGSMSGKDAGFDEGVFQLARLFIR